MPSRKTITVQVETVRLNRPLTQAEQARRAEAWRLVGRLLIQPTRTEMEKKDND